VWFAVDGGELFTMSRSDAGKVKRIRNGGRVLLAPCDGRGRIPPGAPTAEGTARLLDEAGTRRAHALMVRRYLAVRLVDRWRRLVRRPNPSIGIAVTLAPAAG
jgi:PPOX class probable F420-dependent enzyme